MNTTTFPELLSLAMAKTVVFDNIQPISRTECLPISDCCGRVIAEDIIASHCIPLHDRAAMDGYAVKADNTTNASPEHPVVLNVAGAIFAGDTPKKTLLNGECVQVATGSLLPPGADAVVMLEETSAIDGKISITKPVKAGGCAALKGSDISVGDTLLIAGTVLDPTKIGVLASQGICSVTIFAKPTVAIISTGDEIGEVGSCLKQGQIYDINSSTLAAIVRENGCVPVNFPIMRDNRLDIAVGLDEAIMACDIVVTSGGSSVGEKDLLFDVLSGMGDVRFHGVHIKPGGKPTLFAAINDIPVFGMPGPPTSCLLNAYLLLVPALRKIARLKVGRRRFTKARLSESMVSRGDTTKPLPVRLVGNMAEPVFKKGGDITSSSRGDGYVIINAHSEVPKGSEMAVVLF